MKPTQQRILLTNFWGPYLGLHFSIQIFHIFTDICLQFFPENFSRQEEIFLQTMYRKL